MFDLCELHEKKRYGGHCPHCEIVSLRAEVKKKDLWARSCNTESSRRLEAESRLDLADKVVEAAEKIEEYMPIDEDSDEAIESLWKALTEYKTAKEDRK